ncbi:MAG TPA: hypothetical protein PKL98_02915 [Candidatus Pacearchaeota archaeon]|nr:hypothetical protein [Candidatus Pacearchaeota archaeon]
MIKKNLIIISFFFFSALFFANSVLAYRLESFNNIKERGDYLVGPVKTEISLSPGQSRDVEISILNRSGKKLDFSISLEDFSASKNVELIDNSPYSLRDYIFLETSGFSLEHGQKIYLSIQIKIPQYAKPGSMHGAVVVSAIDSGQDSPKAISRIASLFFATVKGYCKLDGELSSFSFKQKNGNNFFEIIFRNQGNAYLNPEGKIHIFDWKNKEVAVINVSNFFVLPQSQRTQDFNLSENIGFGKYKAKLELYKGYGQENISKEIDFWIINKKVLAVFFGLSIVIILLMAKFKKTAKRPI